jgi:serine/threonine-protein kinase RsbT
MQLLKVQVLMKEGAALSKMKNTEEKIEICQEVDIAQAAYEAIRLAEVAGFNRTGWFMLATAASELARNIFEYANKGEVTIRIIKKGTKKGIEIVAEDNGPGIADIAAAMKDSFSTQMSLGLGLPGTKRLTDEFYIDAERRVGIKITVRKWA